MVVVEEEEEEEPHQRLPYGSFATLPSAPLPGRPHGRPASSSGAPANTADLRSRNRAAGQLSNSNAFEDVDGYYYDDDEAAAAAANAPPPRTISTAPAVMPEMIGENQGVSASERTRLYLPRAVVQGAELHCAVGFECDADETYWQHYTTRHNKSKYAGLRSELELAINREFNGSAHAAATTVAFYERPPPPR